MRLSRFWPAVLVSLSSSVALAQPAPAISPGAQADPVPAATADDASDAPVADEGPAEAAADEPDAAAAEGPAEAAATVNPSGTDGVADSTRAPVVDPRAQPGAPLVARHRLVYSNLLVLRVNPLGAEDRFTLGYNLRLYNKASPLFRDAYFGVAFSPTFSPSISRIGGQIDFAPLTILRLRGGYYLAAWYGSDRFKAHPKESPLAAAGPDTVKGEPGTNLLGGQAELSALFQVRVKMIALRNELTFYHNNIRLPGDNTVFYDLRHDTLVPGRGWFLANDTDLLFMTKFGLNAGLRNSIVHVFYPDDDYAPGEDISDNPNTPMNRLGPVLTYTFFDRPEKRFNKPTLIFSAQWWLKHRYRGQGGGSQFDQIHQGIPLFLLGFSFSGDLVKSKN